MELFDEVKNRYFQIVFRVINECSDGSTKKNILKIIDEGEFEQKVIGKNQRSFSGLLLNEYETGSENYCLLKEKDGLYYPALRSRGKNPLPVRLTNMEKAWLHAFLKEPSVRMILKGSTIKTLEGELQEFDTPIRKEYFEMTNTSKAADLINLEEYARNLKTLLKAIVEEKPVRYDNTDKFGKVYKNMLSLPIRIEYSMRDGRFRVSMYSIDNNRPIMANVFSMTNVSLADEDVVQMDREEAKRILYEQKICEEPVILKVTDKRAAMERCFMSFSGMERSARCIGEDQYEIKLFYYTFEEEEVLRNILALGPFVKVISPKRIEEEIIRRIKKSLEMIKP
ncbi:MAG: WYL domain-containing protein [Clostridia bacterium]|nr:WYL domain-containing protein [Clostridia bacterium]